MACMIGAFFIFHLNMVFENTTTLENMMRKRQNDSEAAQDSKKKNFEPIPDYDVGRMENFMQVFGENGFLWLVPIFG